MSESAVVFVLSSELGNYLEHIKATDPVVKAIYSALGAEASTTLEDVFEIPKESVSEGVEKYKGDGAILTPIQVGKVYSTIRNIRAPFEPDALLPVPPAVQAAPSPSILIAPLQKRANGS